MEILYQDEAIAVVVKPRGVLSEEGEGESVPALLRETLGTLYPVHRLDRVVGGVMVYARTKQAAARLSAAVAERALQKEYIAVTEGTPKAAAGELKDFLLKDARQNKSFVVDTPRRGAKEAVLSYRVLDTVEDEKGPLSKVAVKLETGRSHQIRVQFASRGTPLWGDGKYGGRRKGKGPALFAEKLTFPHPQSGKIMEFSAPLPKEEPFTRFGSSQFEIERKFLIAYPDVAMLEQMAGARKWEMVQTYLKTAGTETHRVRAITEKGSTRYVETVKYRITAVRCVEEERELEKSAYEALQKERDPALSPIEKTRYAIPFEGHTVEIDLYPFWQDRAILEVELKSEEEAFSLPCGIKIIKEVTKDLRYKNVRLAAQIPHDVTEEA